MDLLWDALRERRLAGFGVDLDFDVQFTGDEMKFMLSDIGRVGG
jgi:hypothetical protein